MPPTLLSLAFLCLHLPESCAVLNCSSVKPLRILSDVLSIDIHRVFITVHIVIDLFPSLSPVLNSPEFLQDFTGVSFIDVLSNLS